MKVLPLRWHSASRLEQIEALLRSTTQRWLREWAISSDHCDVSIVGQSRHYEVDTRSSERWCIWTSERGTGWIRMSSGTFEQLGMRLVGPMVPDGLGLAANLGRRAMTDLFHQLFGSPASKWLDSIRPMPQSLNVRHGTGCWIWQTYDVRMELFLDANLCDLVAPHPRDQGGLTPRKQSIGHADVSLSAVLHLGRCSLADTLALKPGEIIKTNAKIGQQLSVQTNAGGPIFTGTLVSNDGRRAINFLKR